MLKSLKLSGFKSFSKTSVFEFDTSVSAVVGPNGSGKSNIVEAFKFVLGEQSMRSLRGKQGGDLVFGGSQHVSRSNMAKAKTIFDNSFRNLEVDFDEVSIERVVYRDGVNQYFINGSQVRLKDVHELLAGANIGASSHHIVSQGEADAFLKASPTERRKNIEEALGLSVYRFRKKESKKKLEKTQDNIKEIEIQRRELAPSLRQLKRQVEKARKAKEAQDKLKDLYKEYFKREEIYLDFWRVELENKKRELEDKLKDIDDSLARIKQQNGEDEKSDKIIDIENRMSELSKKVSEIGSTKNENEREVGRIEGQVSYLKKKLESREKESSQHRDQDCKNETRRVPIETILPRIENIIQITEQGQSSENQHEVQSSLRKIKEEASSIVSFLENSSDAFGSGGASDVEEGVQEELNELVEKLSVTKEQLSKTEEEEKKVRREYAVLENELKEAEKGKREAERRMFELKGKRRELEYKLNDLNKKVSDLSKDRQSFETELKNAAFTIGREVLNYASYQIVDDKTKSLSTNDIAYEDRNAQQERRKEIERYKMRLEDIGGASRASEIEKEYDSYKQKDDFLAKELSDLENTAESLRALIRELDQQLDSQFRIGVSKISQEFQRLFSVLFGGGAASLKIVQPKTKKEENSNSNENNGYTESQSDEEVSQAGVDIAVSLPRKHIRGLEMLSGGERTLTSVALVFAMSQINPPPFLILDEVDAALDEANSKRFADMVEDLSHKSQLILVTHNRETMSRAGRLYGVTMSGDGISKLLSVKFDEAVNMIEK